MTIQADAARPQGPYGRLNCTLCGTDRLCKGSVTFTPLNLPADIVPTGALCATCVPDFEASAELRQVARLKVAYGNAPPVPNRWSAFHCPGCGMHVEEGHGTVIDGRLGSFAACHPCRTKADLTPQFRRDFQAAAFAGVLLPDMLRESKSRGITRAPVTLADFEAAFGVPPGTLRGSAAVPR